jgi:hypothetical protein
MNTPLENKLMEAIAALDGPKTETEVLEQISRPQGGDVYCEWWEYVDSTVQELWPSLSQEARLVGLLHALQDQARDWRDR